MQFSAYDELCAYTLSLGDADFIHQHVVDAHAAQNASSGGKPITIFFALVGLYLHLEHGSTGREVQRAHMRLARIRSEWPLIDLPKDRGLMTATDVLAAPVEYRAERIDDWCRSVWEPYSGQRDVVVSVLADADII